MKKAPAKMKKKSAMTMKKKSTMKMAKKSPTKKQMPAGKKGKGVASLPGDVAKNMGYTKDQAGNPIMLKKVLKDQRLWQKQTT